MMNDLPVTSFTTIPIACTSRFTVVINETTPGPLIVLDEGKVTWIRVYNDIPHQNLTMVGPPLTLAEFH
jgi:hypothetical protein